MFIALVFLFKIVSVYAPAVKFCLSTHDLEISFCQEIDIIQLFLQTKNTSKSDC